MKSKATIFFVILMACGLVAHAQIPRTFSFQGMLTDAVGNALPDGSHQLRITLYTQSAGGSGLYTEAHSATVKGGVFSVVVGSVTPIPGTMMFDRRYYAGISVDGGAELTPRTEITAVPYALSASHAEEAGALAAGATGVVTNVNGVDGAVTLTGGGSTTVTRSGQSILITSAGGGSTGIAGLQNTDGTIAVQNPNGPVATIGVADNGIALGKLNATGAHIGDVPMWSGSAVEWTAPAGGGGLTLPFSSTINTTATALDITNNMGLVINARSLNASTVVYAETESSNAGSAIYGKSKSSSGVIGSSTSGVGVKGESESSHGILASSVHGIGLSANSADGPAIYGTSSNGAGVKARAPASSTAVIGAIGKDWMRTGVGVLGFASAGEGVCGESETGLGVRGWSKDGTGVLGLSNTGIGVEGRASVSGAGVQGSSTNTQTAVRGENTSSGAGVAGTAASGTGVYGISNTGIGVSATSTTNVAIKALSKSGDLIQAYSGVFNGLQNLRFRVTTNGAVRCDDTFISGGADLAEGVDFEGLRQEYEPGDVLVISPNSDRRIMRCSAPNSRAVVGVYASKPGMLLTPRGVEEDISDLIPMGVIGIIPTKVCLENGPIRRGDLLVTSSNAGHAMKAIPALVNGMEIYPTGAVLGKALQNHEGPGNGIIEVLVNVK